MHTHIRHSSKLNHQVEAPIYKWKINQSIQLHANTPKSLSYYRSFLIEPRAPTQPRIGTDGTNRNRVNLISSGALRAEHFNNLNNLLCNGRRQYYRSTHINIQVGPIKISAQTALSHQLIFSSNSHTCFRFGFSIVKYIGIKSRLLLFSLCQKETKISHMIHDNCLGSMPCTSARNVTDLPVVH